MAKTADEIKQGGGTCEKVATDFWECTDKDGKVWWCSNKGNDCVPKPRRLGNVEHLTVGLDIVLAIDEETGPVLLTVDRAEITRRVE